MKKFRCSDQYVFSEAAHDAQPTSRLEFENADLESIIMQGLLDLVCVWEELLDPNKLVCTG